MDPAAQNIPFRGKLIWTYNLIFVTLYLLLMSIIIDEGFASLRVNSSIGPSPDTMIYMGAVQASLVRSGEWWRLFWSCYLHTGFLHWATNSLVWFVLGNIIEPDWGFWRTFSVFTIAALTGNMLSITLDSEKASLGASGGIVGLLGACIPYVLEFWQSIHRPGVKLIFICIIDVGTMCLGFLPGIDNYAHIGGLISGIFVGFATLRHNQYENPAPRAKEPNPAYAFPDQTLPHLPIASRASDTLTYHPQPIVDFDLSSGSKHVSLDCGHGNHAASVFETRNHQEKPFEDDFIFSPHHHELSEVKDSNVYRSSALPQSWITPSRWTLLVKSPRKRKKSPYSEVYLWLIRVLAAFFQTLFLLVCYYYIFVCPTCYTAPGHFNIINALRKVF